MTRILHIDSSLFSAGGVSSTLANRFVEELRTREPLVEVTRHDLGAEGIPHLDGVRLRAIATPEEQRDPQQRAIATYADDLIRELQQADILVLGVPMYNFAIPSTLKAWFDYIARAGITFRYTETGPEGLLKGKRAYVFTSRGGLHAGKETDSQTPFIRTMLGFLGISDVEFVYAEGLNLGDEPRRSALEEAEARLRSLAAA